MILSIDIRKMRYELMKHELPYHIINTQEEADSFNETDRKNGIESNWKIGDTYYYIP